MCWSSHLKHRGVTDNPLPLQARLICGVLCFEAAVKRDPLLTPLDRLLLLCAELFPLDLAIIAVLMLLICGGCATSFRNMYPHSGLSKLVPSDHPYHALCPLITLSASPTHRAAHLMIDLSRVRAFQECLSRHLSRSLRHNDSTARLSREIDPCSRVVRFIGCPLVHRAASAGSAAVRHVRAAIPCARGRWR